MHIYGSWKTFIAKICGVAKMLFSFMSFAAVGNFSINLI
jgi:hypothetical protein